MSLPANSQPSLRGSRALRHDDGAPSDTILNDYAESMKKGRDLYHKLGDLAATKTPNYPLSELSYIYDTDDRPFSFPGIDKLREYNADLNFRFVDVLNKGATEHDDAIYSNKFDAKNGMWLIWDVNKARDKALEEERLYPSEACFQSWKHAAAKDKIESPTLRHIVLWTINNTLTKEAIWQAERISACQEEENREPGRRTYSDTDEGFYALLGSPVGHCATMMLIDHKAELGYRTVEKVVVLGVGEDHDLGDFSRSRNVVLVLSERQSP